LATSAAPGGARLTLVLGGARSGKSRYAESLVTALPAPWIYVATAEARDAEMAEVGFGIVPDNALGRRFRDLQGLLNQRIAARADRVVLVVAGLPLTIKGSP